MSERKKTASLLTRLDPAPFRVLDGKGKRPILFICDHASNQIPFKLKNLGLSAKELNRHIAFDRGAAEVTEILARKLGATAVLSSYSRLVVDCNRSPDHKDLIPIESDGTKINYNMYIGDDERKKIMNAIYQPYHQAVAAKLVELDEYFGVKTMLVAIHSFTLKLRSCAEERPWHIGIAYKDDRKTAEKLIEHFRRIKNVVVGDNQPYALENSYTILDNAKNGRAHAFVEIRKDMIPAPKGQKRIADMLFDFFKHNVASPL